MSRRKIKRKKSMKAEAKRKTINTTISLAAEREKHGNNII